MPAPLSGRRTRSAVRLDDRAVGCPESSLLIGVEVHRHVASADLARAGTRDWLGADDDHFGAALEGQATDGRDQAVQRVRTGPRQIDADLLAGRRVAERDGREVTDRAPLAEFPVDSGRTDLGAEPDRHLLA